MPAPTIDKDADDEIELGGAPMVRLPGNSELQSMVPNLSYNDALGFGCGHVDWNTTCLNGLLAVARTWAS
jgi:hypothetical protein